MNLHLEKVRVQRADLLLQLQTSAVVDKKHKNSARRSVLGSTPPIPPSCEKGAPDVRST